ncbi:TetR family transcriptional regulator [Jatrophihabitans sp. YIM 134969]
MSAPRGNRRLSEDDILRAAIALIDVDGLASLTMRRLGASLDVEAMALYRYFPSRHDLLDGVVDHIVSEVATHPDSQWQDDDDWRDYLDRLAHGIRRMALTHPRVFPLVSSHPTAAPWIRPPIRSLSWVDAFLRGLQDHHFPPPAAVTVYKRFSTFLLGHLLLEVAALGLDFPSEASAPSRASAPDADRRDADRLRVERAGAAAKAMRRGDGPSASEILEADPGPRTVADEPAVQAAGEQIGEVAAGADGPVDAVRAPADVPVVAALVSTAVVDLDGYPAVAANAGLLSADTAAADFARDLDLLLDDVAPLRRA